LKVGKLTKVEFKVAKKRAQKSEKIGFVLHISSLVARVSWFVIRGSWFVVRGSWLGDLSSFQMAGVRSATRTADKLRFGYTAVRLEDAGSSLKLRRGGAGHYWRGSRGCGEKSVRFSIPDTRNSF
jgi:hypothetical protein